MTVPVGRPTKRCTEGDYENYGTVLAVVFSKAMTDAGAKLPGAYVLDDGNKANSCNCSQADASRCSTSSAASARFALAR